MSSGFGRIGLAIAGRVVGSAVGGPIGGMTGQLIGTMLGAVLFPAKNPSASKSKAPRPSNLVVSQAQYGTPVPIVYGTRKIHGNLIWYGNFRVEPIVETATSGGGGGGKGGGKKKKTKQVVGYNYFVTLAFSLAMSPPGRRVRVNKIWVGKDLKYDFNAGLELPGLVKYDGTQGSPDSYLQSFEPNTPTYKNLCYVVLKDYALGENPNVPNFTFEVTDAQVCSTYLNTNNLYSAGSIERIKLIEIMSNYLLIYSEGTGGLGGPPYKIHKVNQDTLNITNTVDITSYVDSSSEGTNATGFVVKGNKLYISFELMARVVVVDLSTFTVDGGFYAGDIVTGTDNNIYACKNTHTSSSATKPITGASWSSYWQLANSALNSPSSWEVSKPYVSNVNINITSPKNASDIYAKYDVTPGGYTYIRSISTSSLAQTNQLLLPNFMWVENITSDDSYIYILSEYYGRLVKLSQGLSILGDGLPGFTSVPMSLTSIGAYNNFVYISNAVDSKIYKVNADTSSIVASTSNSGYDKMSIVHGQVWVFDDYVSGGSIFILNAEDLSTICTLSQPTIPLIAVFANAKGSGIYGYVVGDVALFRFKAPTATDALVGDVIQDVITNNLYGLGLNSSYINQTAFGNTRTSDIGDDLYVSMIYDTETNVLDILGHLIKHDNSYITYSALQISHKKLNPNDTSVISLNTADFVKNENELYLSSAKAGGRDLKNKIIIEFTNREKDYVQGTAEASDMPDIDNYFLRNEVIKLEGLTTFNRASKIANIILAHISFNPESISFSLGPKTFGIQPGDIITLTDSLTEFLNTRVRVATLSEGKNYVIKVVGIEEPKAIFELPIIGTNGANPPSVPALGETPLSIINPMVVELPAIYSGSKSMLSITYSRPNQLAWGGTELYQSYSSGGSFNLVDITNRAGVTGTITTKGIMSNDVLFYVDVLLDYDNTLLSALSLDDLITTPYKNICVFKTSNGDVFCKFQTADILSARLWRLSGIIQDLINFPTYNSTDMLSVNDTFALKETIPYTETYTQLDRGRTLYFKLPSFNLDGDGEDISTLTAKSEFIDGLNIKPLSPTDIKINNLGLDSTKTISINSGDIIIDWVSRNRNWYTTDFNLNVVGDDIEFVNFSLEVWRNSILRNTYVTTNKTITYTSAMQSSDGGTGDITFKLKQNNTIISSNQETFTVALV